MIMKKLYSTMMMLAMIVAALGFNACGGDSDDEEEGNHNSSSIVGTWQSSSAEGWLFEDGDETGDEGDYIQFKKDGTFVHINFDESEIESGEWKLNNERLVLHYNDDGTTLVYDVVSVNKKKLVLAIIGLTIYFEKVSDSSIEKYLNGSSKIESTVWGLDGDGDAVRGYKATITYAGDVHEIISPYMYMYSYTEYSKHKYFYFLVSTMLKIYINVSQKPTVGSDLSAYNPKIDVEDLCEIMERYQLSDMDFSSGTAKVIAADSKSITVTFNKYTYTFTSSSTDKTHKLIFDGTIKFLID